MSELTPLQLDAIRVALQFHAVIIQQTLAALNQPPQPQEADNGK